jgi:hypothetical protein
MDISVALMTHDETTEFTWFMEALTPALDVIGEIVVVDDFSGPAFQGALEHFARSMPLRVHRRALNRDFAAQRNYTKSLCRGRLIFFPDPDELPSLRILQGLPRILSMMEEHDIDACQLPRLNVLLDRETLVHPLAPEWEADDASVLWEDQTRILRNLPHLKWALHLNEYLTGIRRGYRFPRTREYALMHCKTRQRQERQRVFYRSVHMRHFSRVANSIRKRLPWHSETDWVAARPPV